MAVEGSMGSKEVCMTVEGRMGRIELDMAMEGRIGCRLDVGLGE